MQYRPHNYQKYATDFILNHTSAGPFIHSLPDIIRGDSHILRAEAHGQHDQLHRHRIYRFQRKQPLLGLLFCGKLIVVD